MPAWVEEPPSATEPGWYLRQDIVWSKPNPMPESVTDRCTKAHEYLFLLAKSARYFYDAEAIAEESVYKAGEGGSQSFGTPGGKAEIAYGAMVSGKKWDSSGTRNRRSVWTVATQPFKEAHFATFPPGLIEPCIMAGCPARCCAKCGAPWVRKIKKKFVPQADVSEDKGRRGAFDQKPMDASNTWQGFPRGTTHAETVGFAPFCACEADTVPGTVIDPFGGAGTTGLVADRLGRNAILMELNPEYAAMARRRIERDAGMFAAVQTEAAQ